jgi:hypothetical protein
VLAGRTGGANSMVGAGSNRATAQGIQLKNEVRTEKSSTDGDSAGAPARGNRDPGAGDLGGEERISAGLTGKRKRTENRAGKV